MRKKFFRMVSVTEFFLSRWREWLSYQRNGSKLRYSRALLGRWLTRRLLHYIKMLWYCCVRGCTNSGGFYFPIEFSLRLKWRVSLRRNNLNTKKLWIPGKYDTVFTSRFTPEGCKVRRLKVIDNNQPFVFQAVLFCLLTRP